MTTTVKYKGRITEISDKLFELPKVQITQPRISTKFDNALYYDGVHYFPKDVKPSDKRENKPYEIQGVFFAGKWRQDTFYINQELKELLTTYYDKLYS